MNVGNRLHIIPGLFRKDTVSLKFWATRPKPCRNCVFPQNMNTKKLAKEKNGFAQLKPYRISIGEEVVLILCYKST